MLQRALGHDDCAGRLRETGRGEQGLGREHGWPRRAGAAGTPRRGTGQTRRGGLQVAQGTVAVDRREQMGGE